MSLPLYQLFLWLYRAGVGLAALGGNSKAKLWISGRRDWRSRLRNKIQALPAGKRIWLHAASLGEFEQGRPVIEALKAADSSCRIILTFFSPSGYEIRKDYEPADVVCYLPLDGRAAARDFINLVNPEAALFIKYEFWYWYLKTLHRRQVPTALVSAAFRKSQPFFRWYGGLFRRMLTWYARIFVQDPASAALLKQTGVENNVRLGGDTRYDRVSAIAAQAKSFPLLQTFRGSGKLLIAGSTWPEDEAVLKEVLPLLPPGWKLVLAPHEIDAAHLSAIDTLFGAAVIRYSALPQQYTNQRVLAIDNIGMLSSLYGYGEVAFIGGGFSKSGIHNVLEPAVFGLPVVFGPVYEKFVEAVRLVAEGLAFPVKDAAEAAEVLSRLCGEEPQLSPLQQKIRAFVQSQTGATALVVNWLLQRLGKSVR